MDTARQILRFSIPGSLFLLHGVVCYLLFRRIQGVPFLEGSKLIQDNIAAVVAVVATIPTGFVIYQLYYFRYEPILKLWLLPRGGLFVRTDRGGQILRTLDPKQLQKLEDTFKCEIDREQIHREVPTGKSPRQKLMHAMGMLEVDGEMTALEKTEKQHAYEKRWYTHWDVLRSTIDIAALKNQHVKDEYTALSDIYHSLGATRTAVTVAWIGVCILSLSHLGRVIDAPLKALGGLVLISALTAGLSFVLHRARGRTWRSAAASLALGLRWHHWQEEHPGGEAQAATG